MIGRLFKEWRDRFLHYAWTRLRIGESGPSVAVADLDPSGHNLPQFLLYLNTNREPAWDEIRTVMSSVVPELGSIQTPVSGDQVRIEYGSPDLGATFNLRDHGTSVEQLLMITCLVTHLPAGGIAVIEEPETNLDPSTQRRLAAQLVEWASTRLLVVSTHSGELLEAAAGDALTLRVERAAGASTVRAVTEALERQRA
jgi:predicted ATPase